MDGEIRVSPTELVKAGQAFASAREIIEEALAKAEREIQPCREMISIRVREDVETWDNIKKTFVDSLENLGIAGQQIQQTGIAFDEVDKARGRA